MVMTMRRCTGLVGILLAMIGCAETEPDMLGAGAPAPALVAGAGAGAIAGMRAPVAGTAGSTNTPMTGGAGTTALGGSGGTGMSAGMSGMIGAAGADAGGATPAGMGGSMPPEPGAGGFPRADEVNVDQMGPYAFDSFTEGTDNATYGSAILYYPTDATPPFAAVVFSPGFTATKESYQDFLGPLLASHGVVMMLTSPTTVTDFPNQRADDLEAAIEQLEALNAMSGSPVQGKLAMDRVCVTGHSMGGGGSLWAANALGDRLRCAVPLQPWQPGQSFSSVAAPTMFITGERDMVAGNASNSRAHYASIPAAVAKYYVEFAGADHYLTTNTRGTNYAVQSRYMIAFYKVYAEDDMRYLEFLDAPADAELSDYQKSK